MHFLLIHLVYSKLYTFIAFLLDILMRILINPSLLGVPTIGKKDLDHQQIFLNSYMMSIMTPQDLNGKWSMQYMTSNLFWNHVPVLYLDTQRQEHSNLSDIKRMWLYFTRNLLWMNSGEDFQMTTQEEYYSFKIFLQLIFLSVLKRSSHWIQRSLRPLWSLIIYISLYLWEVKHFLLNLKQVHFLFSWLSNVAQLLFTYFFSYFVRFYLLFFSSFFHCHFSFRNLHDWSNFAFKSSSTSFLLHHCEWDTAESFIWFCCICWCWLHYCTQHSVWIFTFHFGKGYQCVRRGSYCFYLHKLQ